MNFKFHLLVLVILFSTCALPGQTVSTGQPVDSWLTKRLTDSGKYILTTKDYRVWGCAPIYDDQGKVHVYFSTWENNGSWLTNSKVAHAVADHPEGPYKVLGTILEGRGEDYWDAHSIHNPSIYRVDGKYVLLYIGNDTSKQEKWRIKAPQANSQRTGIAIADSPYGPWKRFDKPMIDVSPDSSAWDGYCTVNPGFLKHPNGEYWIYYRAWDRNNDDRRKTGVAMAKNLEGPYEKYAGNPVIDFPEYGGQTEDPFFFFYKEKFHCLIRDMGNFDWLSGLYLESEDGLNWGEYKRSHHQGSHYFPVSNKARYERVQVLFKDGEPEYLFNSIQRQDGYSSGAVLKINLPKSSGQNLTKPKKHYADSIDFSFAPVRRNNKYPLSDQPNKGKWKLLKDYSDEFSDDTLDIKKWYPNNPKWKGRPPTYFHGSNVSLENGEMIMKINQHGNEVLPEGFTHTSGFIKSKKKLLYGYVEARLKPINAPWVTGFWMTNVARDWWTEIDICENCPGVEDNRHDLNSNIHVFKAPKDKGDVKEHFSRNKKYYIPFELHKDYHVWGLEWDEDYIRFYLDGVLFRVAENTHWHQELEINFNTESNKWFGALPDDSRLNEKYRVDYFRVWQKKK